MVPIRVLDLFSGGGGAAKGYQDAGFYVVGVDHLHQPDYCGDEINQEDVFDFLDENDLSQFDVIHASPPCQAYSMAGNMPNRKTEHPRLVEPIQQKLAEIGIPYVIENVPGAPLVDPILLCGTSFGLGVDYSGPSAPPGRYHLRRHRLFESSLPLRALPCRLHETPTIGIYGNHASYARRKYGPGKGQFSRTERVKLGQEALGVDWMTDWEEITEAIPPVYTYYLGKQIKRILATESASHDDDDPRDDADNNQNTE